MPDEAPQKPDHWSQIIPDVERLLMPGITHVPSPMFNAYYPAGYSYPSIVGEILSAGIGCVVLNRETSPACTELEVIVLDWLAKMFGLPRHFLASDDGPGGGIIQQSASEGVLVALLAAKMRTVKRVKMENPDWDEDIIKTKLVAYSSVESNLCVEKAGKLGSMTLRLLPADQDGRLRGAELARAILRDKHRGLIPCYVVATLGTTGTCAFDCLQEIGQVCQPQRIWLHVDAAYAGAAFVCPEYRHLMEGVELADSFTMNPHKWLLANFDCSTLWVKDRKYILDAFSIERPYMKSVESDRENYAPDFRNWEIGLGRRFRSLKLWLTLRLYGVAALQDRVRHHVSLAQRFANHVRLDPRFEIYKRPQLGLVCFKLKVDETLIFRTGRYSTNNLT
ncbi:hypothetical protein AAG570_001583 [Ranatra chinensis]|uniref:Dopa decarboxylase n=1 Tax=Ranatra chinensis TaxID=642074 RepID=A0ABD0Y979_9HEMI